MRRSAPSARSTPASPTTGSSPAPLENRWEEKLSELKDAEAELAEHVVPSTEPSRKQIEALARDLPGVWGRTEQELALRACSLITSVLAQAQPCSRSALLAQVLLTCS